MSTDLLNDFFLFNELIDTIRVDYDWFVGAKT